MLGYIQRWSLRASRAVQKSSTSRAALRSLRRVEAEQLKSEVHATLVEWFLLNLPLMKPVAAKERARPSGPSRSYLKTRVRGSRLLAAAHILAIVELSRRLHQAYAQAYDKQAADSVLPQNPFPGFDKGKLGDVNKALAEGAKLLQNSDCQKALAQAGINVTDLIKAFGNLKARPDSDPSTKGYNIFYAEKSTDPQVQQFLQTESGKGAGGFIYGQDVMLRKAFFNAHAARIGADISRALALIHEAVHLTGKSDAFFGGSAKLNDVVIHACWSKLYGHKDLAIVGN